MATATATASPTRSADVSAQPSLAASPSPDLSIDSIEKKYSGFVHKEAVPLDGQTYEVYYWNNGDFDYTQFLIANQQEVLFDSQQAGLKIEGGYISDKAKNIWTHSLLQNNRPTFLFSLADNRPESAYIILENIDGAIKVTVQDNVQVNYEDVDQDGSPELLASPYSGQVPLGPALYAVYELKGNQYVPNTAKTNQYWEKQLLEGEKNYKADPTEGTLEVLLDAYLVLDRLDEAKARFPEFYKLAGQTSGDGGFVDTYLQTIKAGSYDHISGWMNKLKPLRTLESK
ncbi:hypothetical protein [Paenibacillus sp. HW567]|uniref:hypothetical protein n=1 Tax=Paenibacillus sp. HW567 TaxID=1034769 RepID=UPI0003A72F18|nr:hypothetical protein [Paenibacillus sp. HW567]